MPDLSLRALVDQLVEERNFELRGYKFSTLQRRFQRRMAVLKITSYSEYLSFIREHDNELTELLNTVLINVTDFFRDPPAWKILADEIIPSLTAGLHPGDSFRCWTPGCATGQEPYSLAMLLQEHFGPAVKDFDIKIYATDVDEEALKLGRRADYTAKQCSSLPPEYRRKYFLGENVHRLVRDIRRMVVFGRSNLALDPPISRIKLVLCRNVLIYFELESQARILQRLHYALRPDGILMLGRSESQLTRSNLFQPLHAKWRIFRCRNTEVRVPIEIAPRQEKHLPKPDEMDGLLQAYNQAILETIEPGVIVVDSTGIVTTCNKAVARLLQLEDSELVGKRIQQTEVLDRIPEIAEHLEGTQANSEPFRFEHTLPLQKGEAAVLAITVKAISGGNRSRAGTLIYIEDITARHRLRETVAELQDAGEKLHTTNEELETTAEELQSTNEELETTNEELQSTNEELETSNEELQALNEELGTTNEELEVRTKELDEINSRYVETLEKTPWPLLLVQEKVGVQVWNSAAQRLFGLPAKSVIGLELKQLPVPEALRNLLSRSYRETLGRGKGKIIHNFYLDLGQLQGPADVHVLPLGGETGESVLFMFQTFPQSAAADRLAKTRAVLIRRAGRRSKKPQANKKSRRRR
jgi:two-component system CheB/CheR fusion protein